MGDIRKLRAISANVRRQEEYQQRLRDEEREKKRKEELLRQREKERQEALKNRKQAEEADALIRKHKEENNYKPIDSLFTRPEESKKQDSADIIRPVTKPQPSIYKGPFREDTIFGADDKLNKYDWTRSEKKMKYTPMVQKMVDKYEQAESDKRLRYATTPARIANMMADQADLEEALAAMGSQNDANTMAMKEELKKIKSDIQKEVDWYTATTPKEENLSPETLSAYQSGDLGAVFGLEFNEAQRQAHNLETRVGKADTRQNLLSDAYHTFMISKNEVQRQTSQGKINTLQQQLNMANPQGLDEYQDICEQYIQLNQWLNGVKRRYTSGQGITPEEKRQWDPVQKKINELNSKKEQYENMFNNLATFENQTTVGDWVSNSQKYLNKLNLDFGTGVGGSLKGYGENITGFQKALANRDQKAVNFYKNKLKGIFKNFSAKGEEMKKLWQRDYDIDTADLNRWTSNYKVSEYFKQKEQEANDLAWYNPKKLWMAPSLLGSSMSSPEKTLMSMGAGLTALAGSILAPETGGASIALTAGAVSFLSGMAAGADENFANVADATNEIAKKDLAKKGQMDKFLADARKVLGYNTTEEDALQAFYLGKYVPNDFKIRQTLLDATAGSAKQYYQGMGVNTWDSLVDAIVTCMPTGGIAKSSKVGFLVDKVASKADRKLLKMQLSKYMRDNNVSLKEAIKVFGEEGVSRTQVSNAINDLRQAVNAPANYLRTLSKDVVEKMGLPVLQQKANALLDKGLAKMAERSLSHTANVTDMLAAVPERVLKYRKNLRLAGKLAKDLGWRTAASMYSEGAEEGIQQLQQYQRMEERSNAYFNVLEQLPLTIIDGAKLWSTFLFKDPENLTAQERDIVQQMHGGILGALLQGGPNIAAQGIGGTYKQYKLDQIVMNNLLADNIATNDYLDKARILSQELTKGNYKNIIETLNQYDDITTNMRNRHKDDPNWALPQNHVSNLHKLLNVVANLQQNEEVKKIKNSVFNYEDDTKGVIRKTAKSIWDNTFNRKDAKRRSQLKDDYNTYVGILATRLNEINDSKQFLDEKTKDLISARFNQHSTFEDYINNNQADPLVAELSTKIEKGENGYHLSDEYKDNQDVQEKFKLLQQNYQTRNSNLETLHDLIGQMQTMQLLQDMEKIKQLPGGATLSSRAKFEVDRTKKRIHEIYGDNVKLDTEEDVRNFAASKGYNIDNDYVDALRQVSDARMQVNFNTEMFNRLITNTKDAVKAVKSFKENRKADEELRQSIEDDFYNNEIDRQKFEASEINDDNNTFTKDGKTYVVRDDSDGVRRVYEYDSENDKLIPTSKRFNKREWYDSRQQFDTETTEHEKLRAKYNDYKSLLDKNADDLTDQEKERLETYKGMLNKFNRFDESEQTRNKYLEASSKAPGLKTDYTETIENLTEYAKQKKYTQDQFDELVDELAKTSNDGYRTREQKIRKWVEDGRDVEYSYTGDSYFIGSDHVSKEAYDYAKWLQKRNKNQDDVVEDDEILVEPPIVPKTQPKSEDDQRKSYQKPETTFTHNGKPITLQQAQVLTQLQPYLSSNEKYHYEWRTSENYFIEENGKIVMYKRLHSLLDPYIADEPEKTESIKENTRILQAARDKWKNAIDNNESSDRIKELKKEYVSLIEQMRDEYNEIVMLKYSQNESDAKRFYLNFDGYFQNDDILISDDAVNAMATMLARKDNNLFEVGSTTVSGTIVDEIARSVFAHSRVDNIPRFKMSDEIFSKLVKDLEKERDRWESLGYTIVTNGMCFHGEIQDKDGNMVRVAGETDMLAIAPDGSITIVDYKTSRKSWETKQRPTGTQSVESVIDALDWQYNKRYDFGKRQRSTARVFYTNQLNAYRQMITNCTGLSVANLQLMGFQTDIEESNDRILLNKIKSIGEPTIVDIAILDPVLSEHSYIEQRDIIEQRIKKAKERTNDAFREYTDKFTAVGELMQDVQDPKLQALYKYAKGQIDKIGDIDQINDLDRLNQLYNWINNSMASLRNLEAEAQQALNAQSEDASRNEGITSNSKKFNAPHRVYNDEELKHYNHTAQDPKFLNNQQKKELQIFKDWTTQPDFAQNVQFEIDFDASGFIHGVPTAGARLKFKSISYNGVKLSSSAVQNISFMWSVDQDASSLRQRLIQCFNDNYDDIKSGKKKIVLKNVQRTNGKLLFGDVSKNVQEALELSDEQVSNLLNYDSDAVLLISDSAGIVRRLDSEDKKAGSGTAERISKKEENRNRPGIVYIQKQLHYAEDEGSGNKPHTALIPLTPAKMSSGAVDLIIDILTNTGKSKNMSVKDNNGNTIPGPINRSLLLHYLIRFGGGAEAMMNSFQFNYESNGQNGFDYSKVFISTDRGQTKTTYNLKDIQDVQKLREWLLNNAYLNVQNISLIRDNVATSKDGIFEGVKEWFNNHPDIESISYSDEFVITREDVDSNIGGIQWMIKNNWLQSQYIGITDAIVSANDFDIIDQAQNAPENIQKQQDDFDRAVEEQLGPIPDGVNDNNDQNTTNDAPISFDDCDNAWGNIIDPSATLFMRNPEHPKRPITEKRQMDKAVQDVKRMCGNTVLIETLDSVQMSERFGDAVGACTQASIVLSYGAENGVQYHEAFHRVVELAMPKEERDKLYNIYKTKYAKNTNLEDIDVAEDLADMYFDYSKNVWHPRNKLFAKLFSKIYNYINALLTTKSFKFAATFVRIDYGKYAKNEITKENQDRFTKEFHDVLKMTLKDSTGKEHVFNNVYTQTQLKDAVDVLLPLIIKSQGIDILGSNADTLKTDKKSLLAEGSKFVQIYRQLTCGDATELQLNQAVAEGKLSPLTRNNALALREVFDNWSLVQPMLEDRLRAVGLRSKLGDVNQISADVTSHTDDAFYSHSMSDDIGSAMLYLLSTIPNQRYVTQEDVASGLAKNMYATDKNGNIIMENGKPKRATIPAIRNSFGMTSYLPFKAVHQRMLTELHDVKDVRDLVERLKRLGEVDYLFNTLAQYLERFRYLSYIRFSDKEKFGEYVGFPVVMYNGVIVDPSYYIADTSVRNEDTMYPKQIRLVKDLKDKKGNLICKAGDILQGAAILQDQDKQTLTTLFYQSIKSQKMNFNFFNIRNSKGENGRYEYSYQPTNTDRSISQLPIGWFDNIRIGLTGLYNKDGSVNKSNKSFETTRQFLMSIRNQLINNSGQVQIGNKVYKMNDAADFDYVVSATVQSLNNVGIMVNKATWYNMLHRLNPNETDYTISFREIMTASNEKGLSIAPFIEKDGVLDKLQKAVDSGNLNMFTQDVANAGKKSGYSGAYLYARNNFVRRLAEETGVYRSATSEIMTIGAGDTKLYMYAQNNTASDVTDDLNLSLNEDGTVREGSILSDMQNVEYVVYHDDRGGIHGSIIAKALLDPDFNKNHNRLDVVTEAGSKQRFGPRDSVKFAEMGKREDYLSRIQKITDGFIIFPTLSDKSTYMAIRGFDKQYRLPGFNYDQNITENSSVVDLNKFGKLPFINKNNGTLIFDAADKYNNYSQNEVIDQFIEYYEAEHRNVLKTLNELGFGPDNSKKLPKEQLVKNYHTGSMNGARYTSISGIYDENDNFISFNFKTDSEDKGVIECNKLAEKEFFSKPIEEKRAIVARMLKHRLDEELKALVDAGIIQTQKNDNSSQLNAAYNNYKNIFLSNNVITRLKQAYLLNDNFKKATRPLNAESLAVVAYVYDIMCKHMMCIEETRRFYTGMPQFFKTSFGEDGRLTVFGNDETKRYGGVGSTGVNNREDIPGMNDDYRVAEINDWETPSPVLDSLGTLFKIGEYREAVANIRLQELGENASEIQKFALYDAVNQMDEDAMREVLDEAGVLKMLDKKIEKEAKAFSNVNVADGTAFISDKMCENLLKQRGAFTKAVENAFKILRGDSDDYLKISQAYKTIHKAMISTQKYSAFGYRMENGIPVHYYNKYALFPVFKGISYGFMKNLYEKMNDAENGVDVVLFTSAVKAGSRGAQRFDPNMSQEEIKNFSFKGHIYKQKYKHMRRQLNTDPRTDEIMSAGTQALKVVLSTLRDGQTYNILGPDGQMHEAVSSEVRNRVMELLNKVANLGWNKLQDQFFTKGHLDYSKLQDFLTHELLGRDADQNILDALQLNENKDGFIVDLNSVSNMTWVESILTSKVNKDVIDLQLKGNAFYQRSIFGMDSPYIAMSDDEVSNEINGGKPLQMINEEGSMDAVVSIDYFMDIIPKEYKYNFNKAKQWLIDNGIISGVKTGEIAWSNAEANTMSYRIPTQAASSIGALRFVDVLPIVRDTIVLPKEFTAQTGSDFDIDKLYMSTLHYDVKSVDSDYVDKKGQIHRKKVYNAESYNLSDDINNNTNELLRIYLSLLKDTGKYKDGKIEGGRYGHVLRRSIDSDTDLIKEVLSEIESKIKQNAYEPYQFESMSFQVDTRSAFATGKTGIGPFALNNNSQILTQIYGLKFIDDGGILSSFGALSLDRTSDVDGKSILSWISGMINAHVDVAKDPYILRLNINKDTYNLAALLLRLGFGRHTLYFLNNPVMRELSIIRNEQDGQIVNDPGKTPTQRKEKAEADYIKEVFGDNSIASSYINAKPDEKDDIAKRAFKIIVQIFGNPFKEHKETTILQDICQNLYGEKGEKKVTDLSKDKIYTLKDGTKLSPFDVQQYVYIASKEFESYAQGLSDLVQYTKIDTKKQGINYTEQQKYLQGYEKLYNSGMFNSNLKQLLNDSYIHTKTIYGTSFLPKILGRQMIHMSYQFQAETESILDKINNHSRNSREAVQKAMLCYIKQKAFNKAFRDYVDKYNEQNNTEYTIEKYWEHLIKGNDTLSNRIQKLQRWIQADNKGLLKEFGQNGVITNAILKNLYPVPYIAQYGQDHFDIITLGNNSEDEKSISNDYIYSWEQMLNYTNSERPGLQKYVRDLANDLAIYAFMTSADSKGFTKFFKYAPLQWRKQFGYCDNIAEANKEYQEGSLTLTTDTVNEYGIDFDDFIQNFYYDNNILPETSLTDRNGRQQMITSAFTYSTLDEYGNPTLRTEPKNIIGLNMRGNKYAQSISKNKDGYFPEYIKTRRNGTQYNDNDQFLLYKLVDIGVVKNGNVELEYPIYQIINAKGLQMRIGSQTYQFYSCGMNDNYERSQFTTKDKSGNRVKPTMEQVQESYNNRKAALQKYINENNYSILDAVKKAGLVSKNDIFGGQLSSIQEAAYGGIVSNKNTVNVNFGASDNPHLSNFAKRPISDIFDVVESFINSPEFYKIKSTVKHKADTVENAFQALKVLYSDLNEDDKVVKFNHIISLPSAKQARAEGNAIHINKANMERWDSVSTQVLSALMRASFEENSDAAQALVDTGDKIITHNNAKGESLDNRFAPILTQIRQELTDEGYSSKEQQLGSNSNISQNTLNITPANTVDKKASIKGSMANKFIGFADGIAGSSTANYAKQAGEYANVGNYNSNDIVFVSIPGKRGNETIRHEQQNRTIQECLKALKSGATLLTDNKEYTKNSNYNEGEKRLAEALTDAGAQYSEVEKDGQKIGIWTMAKQQSSNSKKYYYYNSKPIGGISVKDLKTLMKNMKSFVVTSDMPGEGTDSTTQYIPYSEYKNSYFAYFADRISREIELVYGIPQDEFSKNIIYYDKSKKAMVIKSKGLYNTLKAFGIDYMYNNSNNFAKALGYDFDSELIVDLLSPYTNQEIGEKINTALYGDRRIIDSAQLELFEDQSMLVKMAEKTGMSVEQLKQNLESRQEYINKSLKDYPANEALDELADQIDEQCK